MNKLIAVVLAGAMLLNMGVARAYADESAGKYVSDVFIAYGHDEAEATKWLKDNGWEPVAGDFNAGKNSSWDKPIAAVMGIKRTDNEDNAITDIAVMNMTGGYSLPDYEKLIQEKKTQIDEFINSFMVVINEFRANYNGEGSEFGQKRAQLAYDALNKFYDGDPKGDYAVNDTGMKLGDFFIKQLKQEGNKEGGDLQQMILESSGPAMFAVESLLTMGTDTGEETWLERASGLTGDEMAENLPKYAPEAEGQDVAESVVAQYLNQKYGDTATMLAEQYLDVHEFFLWYESYCDQHGLWPKKGESDDAYSKRLKKYFDDLKKNDEDAYDEDADKFTSAGVLYDGLYEMPYEGDWGETMGDFFNPADGENYGLDPDNFLPMAAGLSEGQRAGLEFLNLRTMLLAGLGAEAGLDAVMPEVDKVMGEHEEMDIFTGINRGIFRGGVAMTSQALMEQNAGNGQAFDRIWDNEGIVAITSNAAAFAGLFSIGMGCFMVPAGITAKYSETQIATFQTTFDKAAEAHDAMVKSMEGGGSFNKNVYNNYISAQTDLENAKSATTVTKMGIAGRWMLGIGGALLIAAAIVRGVQLWQYYDRDMKPIPLMIVDESDIVTYLTDDAGKPILDENGDQKKSIEFNDYEYYQAVKCNRRQVGELDDWNDGVEEYKAHGCFDVADLNADYGQEWVVPYTVKSKNKGYPILADSLTVQYGSSSMPKNCKKSMHLFTYTNAVDLGDTAWAYNNNKKGVYLFWDEDTSAFPADAASAFSRGHIAMACAASLALGILGTTLALYPKRKKERELITQDETTV